MAIKKLKTKLVEKNLWSARAKKVHSALKNGKSFASAISVVKDWKSGEIEQIEKVAKKINVDWCFKIHKPKRPVLPETVVDCFLKSECKIIKSILVVGAACGKRLADILRICPAECFVRSNEPGHEEVLITPGRICSKSASAVDKRQLLNAAKSGKIGEIRPFVVAAECLSSYPGMSLVPLLELLKEREDSPRLFRYEDHEVRRRCNFPLHSLRINKAIELKVIGKSTDYITSLLTWKSDSMLDLYTNKFSAQ